jgi:hypothetical protein
MNYAEMTKKQLIAHAADRKVALPAKANVATIVAALEAADKPAAATPTGNGLKIEKDRPEQNGIKRPSAGGRCRAVWDALDAYRAETGDVPTAKVVASLAADEGWNPNNASIEFYQWRKYNGITGRQPKPAKADAE